MGSCMGVGMGMGMGVLTVVSGGVALGHQQAAQVGALAQRGEVAGGDLALHETCELEVPLRVKRIVVKTMFMCTR